MSEPYDFWPEKLDDWIRSDRETEEDRIDREDAERMRAAGDRAVSNLMNLANGYVWAAIQISKRRELDD